MLAMLTSVNDCRGPGERISDGDVAAIARSVERYRVRWIANGWHRPAWLAKQARLAPRGGKASGRASPARPPISAASTGSTRPPRLT